MTVSDALRGVRSLGLDTAPIIYYVERNPTYHFLCVPIFTAIDGGQIDGVTTTMTLPETLMHPLRNQDTVRADAFRNLILRTAGITAIPLSADIAEGAASLRALYNLRTPDAVQIATAIRTGCDAFLTNDRALQRVSEIRVIILGDLTL